MMKSSSIASGVQRPSLGLTLPRGVIGLRGEQLGMRLVANAKTTSSEDGRTKSSQAAKTASSRVAKTVSSKTVSSKEAKTVSSKEAKTVSSREAAKTQSSRALARTQSSRTSSREEEEEEDKPPPKPLIDEQFIADVKAKVEYLISKPQLIAVSGGAVLGLGLTAVIISAIHDVPVLPKALELAGLGYSAWFVYTYLLKQGGRQQLSRDVEALKEKVLDA